jgi:opacity protein-like surface antigen
MTTTVLKGWLMVGCGAAVMAAVLAPEPASAQIVRVGTGGDTRQAIGFNLGYFSVKGEDGRVDNDGFGDDVWFNDLDSLLFDIKDFNGATFGAEWLFAVTENLEVGAGIDYYQRTVPSIYRSLVDIDGTEIEQDLKLRQVPISATVRFLPLGRNAAVQPYIGAGVGIINWRYSETGEFVDFNNDIFRDSFEASGSEVGPVILGGVRFPVSDIWLIGGEIRWHSAKGDTGGIDEGFLGDTIDLGGLAAKFAIHFRF